MNTPKESSKVNLGFLKTLSKYVAKKLPHSWLKKIRNYRTAIGKVFVNPIYLWIMKIVVISDVVCIIANTQIELPRIVPSLFTFVFLIEFLLKLFVNGLHRYFTGPFKVMDFILVSSDIFVLLYPNSRVKYLSSLRPFRLFSKVSIWSSITLGLLGTIPRLGPIAIFLTFILMLGSTIAKIRWVGKFSRRCTIPYNHNYNATLLAALQILERKEQANYLCDIASGSSRFTNGRSCPNYLKCMSGLSPENGIIRYDNFESAWTTILRLFFLDYWNQLSYWTIDCCGQGNVIFYLIFVFVGSYFVQKLWGAVIVAGFQESLRREEEIKLMAKIPIHAIALDLEENSFRGDEEEKTGESIARFLLHHPHVTKSGLMSHKKMVEWVGQKMVDYDILDGGEGVIRFRDDTTKYKIDLKKLKHLNLTSLSSITRSAQKGLNNLKKSVPEQLQKTKRIPKPFWRTCAIIVTFSTCMSLGLEHHGQSSTLDTTISLIQFLSTVFFSMLFFVEMISRQRLLSSRKLSNSMYYKDVFELGMVACGWGEVLIVLYESHFSTIFGNTSFPVWSLFRLYRPLRLVNVVQLLPLPEVKYIFLSSIRLVFMIVLFLQVFVLMYALLGHNFFKMNKTLGVLNFNTLQESYLTAFVLTVGKAWVNIMYEVLRTHSTYARLHFILWIFWMKFTINNLPLVIILNNFKRYRGSVQNEKKASVVATICRTLLSLVTTVKIEATTIIKKQKGEENKGQNKTEKIETEEKAEEKDKHMFIKPENKNNHFYIIARDKDNLNNFLKDNLAKGVNSVGIPSMQEEKKKYLIKIKIPEKFEGYTREELAAYLSEEIKLKSLSVGEKKKRPLLTFHSNANEDTISIVIHDSKYAVDFMSPDTPREIFGFGKKILKKCVNIPGKEHLNILKDFTGNISNAFRGMDNFHKDSIGVAQKRRKLFVQIAESPLFKNFMYLMVFSNSLLFVFGGQAGQYQALEVTFAVTFTFEIILKFICYGYNRFFMLNLELIDLVVVITSLLGFATQSNFWRLFRCFRLLRLFEKSSKMDTTMKNVGKTIFEGEEIAVLLVIFLYGTGIMGVNLFKGRLGYCTILGPNVTGREDCTGEWKSHTNNFDRIYRAMMTLAQVGCTRGWVGIMKSCLLSRGIDAQPYARDDGPGIKNPEFFIFFAIFVITIEIFFVKFIFALAFRSMKEVQRQNMFSSRQLKEDQEKWALTQNYLLTITTHKYYEPRKKSGHAWMTFQCREKKYKRIFQKFYVLVSLLNAVTLLPDDLEPYQSSLSVIFTMIILSEFLIKINAIGLKAYFLIWGNRYHFCLVLAAISDMIVVILGLDSRIFRTWRIAQLFRIINYFRSVEEFFTRVKLSFADLVEVLSVFIFFLFFFSILGMDLYSGITDFDPYKSKRFNENLNFVDFIHSFHVVFRVSTGDAWAGVMHATKKTYDDVRPPGFEHASWSPYLFFPVVFCIMNFIFINLFVSVLLENFYDLPPLGVGNIKIEPKDVSQYTRQWARLDRVQDKTMTPDRLIHFIISLSDPLGVGKEMKKTKSARVKFVKSFLKDLDLPVMNLIGDKETCVSFVSTLRAIFHRKVGPSEKIPDDLPIMKRVAILCTKNAVKREPVWVKDSQRKGYGRWEYRMGKEIVKTFNTKMGKGPQFAERYYMIWEDIAARRLQSWWRTSEKIKKKDRLALKNAKPKSARRTLDLIFLKELFRVHSSISWAKGIEDNHRENANRKQFVYKPNSSNSPLIDLVTRRKRNENKINRKCMLSKVRRNIKTEEEKQLVVDTSTTVTTTVPTRSCWQNVFAV